MAHRVITANRLHDGSVVWMAADGTWVPDIARAAASDSDETAAAALARARADEAAGGVIGVYEVEVELDDATWPAMPRPVRLREKIRAGGPTVATV